MAFTLISVSTLDRAGYALHVEDANCSILSPKPTRKPVGIFPMVRGLYRATTSANVTNIVVAAYTASQQLTIFQAHKLMGHPDQNALMQAIKAGTITGIKLDMSSIPEFCDVCVQAKAARQPIPRVATSERPTEYGGKVVVDLKGPMSVASIRGALYAMTPMDLSTHEEKGYFFKLKSEAFDHYKKYEAWVKTQRGGAVIKILGSDGGGEFTSNAFTDHLEKAGTIRHLTVHDTRSSNGIAERAQRTHAEQTRAMLIQSGLPKFLWAEGWLHSIWLRN